MKILHFIEKHQNAIAATLMIHVFIFVWLNMQHISFYTIKPKEKVVATLDFTLDQLREMETKEEELDGENALDLTNVTSNFSSDKPTNKSAQAEKIEKEVLNELTQFENETFNSLSKDNPTLKQSLIPEENQDNVVKSKSVEKTNEAIAKYFVEGRYTLIQNVPSYLCNSSGIVRLIIRVNQKGIVTDCKVDDTKTTTQDECLISNALKYTKNWKFNSDFKAGNRMDGWVEFIYLSQ